MCVCATHGTACRQRTMRTTGRNPGHPPPQEAAMSTTNRALIVIDVQQEYFDGPLEIQYPPRDESRAQILRAIDVADEAGIPVVIVQHELPEEAPVFAKGSAGFALH